MRKLLKRMLSKLFIVSGIIILQLIWFFFLFYTASETSHFLDGLIRLAALFLALYIANRQIKIYIKLSWIFLILSLPIVGIPCYFFFGRPELTKHTQRRMRKIVDAYSRFRPENAKINNSLKAKDLSAYRQSRLIMQNQGYPLYKAENATYYKCGEDAYKKILDDLETAENFIFIEYFIIGPGKMFDGMFEILKRKVEQGVTVKIIYDDFGSINVVSASFISDLRKAGLEICRFNPYKPILSVIMNDRDHRKILVIDGKIAHTGGYNISDEYINEKARFGYWKDAGIRLEGACVNSFTTMFLEMWSYITKDGMAQERFLRPQNPYSNSKGFVQPFCDSPLESDDVGENIYLSIISRAKEYVYMFTPYLILSAELAQAMINAAKSGVDVRIVTPGIPDKKLIYIQTKANFRQLMEAGVRIYKYTPGFIHSKCMVSDDTTAVVGTGNLDFRSLYWNFENFVYMYDMDVVLDVKKDAIETFEVSEELCNVNVINNSFAVKMIQSILQLFAPLL